MLMRSSSAICLFSLPATIRPSTSRSRCVKLSSRCATEAFAARLQFPVQIQSVHAGHAHVEHQTAAEAAVEDLEERLRRGVQLDLEPARFQQPLERIAH